jgi:PAS domain S-box-containing protein
MSSAIRVLHVEDDPEFGDLAAEFLQREDDRLDVVTKHHPEDALAWLRDNPVDCVVSDYDLPELDGIELLDAIRGDEPELPFVLFTGKGSEEVASDAISAGATDYLQKEGGTDQYAILANRVVNAVEQREARTNYHEIFEKAADGIFLHDPETGRVNDVNPKAAEMLGYDREELVDMDVGEFSADWPEFSQAEAAKRVRSAMEEGPQTFEWLFEAKDGGQFWIEVHLKRVVINGRVQVIAMTRDVSERKQRKRELREERDRRAALFENRTDAIAYVEFVDGDPVVKTTNHAFEETFGYDEAAVVGSRIGDALVSDGEAAPETSQWARDGDYLDREVTRATADGPHTFRLRTAPLDSDDEPTSGYVVYTDVTDRKERERRLQHQKEKVESLHDVAADIEACESPRDVYNHVLDAAEDILNYDRGIVDAVEGDSLVPIAIPEGVPEEEYHKSTPIDADDSLAARAYRRGESILVDDVAILDVAPAEPTYRSAMTVPIDGYGMFQAVAEARGVFDETDLELTELLVKHARETLTRLEREEELREYAAELERQNERLEGFASVVSHDLRGPLNVADGRVDLAQDDTDSDHLDIAADALDRMNDIVEHTLSLAREGQAVGETEHVDVSEIAEQAWHVIETDDATLRVADDATVEADPERVQHLFENLFRNAVEHGSTSPGSETRQDAVDYDSTSPQSASPREDAVDHDSTSPQSASPREDAVEHAGRDVTVTVGTTADGFYVADDGPGVPESEREDVFEPGHTTAEDGTGFGLAIVKGIVSAHQGDIAITESETGGARFDITGFDVA